MTAEVWAIALGHLAGAAILVTLGVFLDRRSERR